jgi:hypothetical protein
LLIGSISRLISELILINELVIKYDEGYFTPWVEKNYTFNGYFVLHLIGGYG